MKSLKAVEREYVVSSVGFYVLSEGQPIELDANWILLTCSMTDATGGAGHAYHSGAVDVNPVFVLCVIIIILQVP